MVSQYEMNEKRRQMLVLLSDPLKDYSVKELSEMLNVSQSSVRIWIKKNERVNRENKSYRPIQEILDDIRVILLRIEKILDNTK